MQQWESWRYSPLPEILAPSSHQITHWRDLLDLTSTKIEANLSEIFLADKQTELLETNS